MTFDHYEIRIIEKEDAASYFQLIDNNRVCFQDFIAGIVSQTNSLADTETFITQSIEKNISKTYFPYVVINMQNQELIGYIDVKNIDWRIPKAEIGYFVDGKHTGKGIGTNAVSTIADHLFNQMEFVKLLLRIHVHNMHSVRLAQKCGFIMEGTIRKDYKTTQGQIVDMMYYGKINPRFE